MVNKRRHIQMMSARLPWHNVRTGAWPHVDGNDPSAQFSLIN
jgi:hypothetical protein